MHMPCGWRPGANTFLNPLTDFIVFIKDGPVIIAVFVLIYTYKYLFSQDKLTLKSR